MSCDQYNMNVLAHIGSQIDITLFGNIYIFSIITCIYICKEFL